MGKEIDDALEPIRENIDSVKALADSDLSSAWMAQAFLDHMDESETNEPGES